MAVADHYLNKACVKNKKNEYLSKQTLTYAEEKALLNKQIEHTKTYPSTSS
jgi:hypothetical protein